MYRLLNKSAKAISEKSFSLSQSGKSFMNNNNDDDRSIKSGSTMQKGSASPTTYNAKNFRKSTSKNVAFMANESVNGRIVGERRKRSISPNGGGPNDEGSRKLEEFLGLTKATTVYDWVRGGEYTDYDEKRKFVAGRISGSNRSSSRISKYISSVLFNEDDQHVSRVLQMFTERATNALFKWAVEHIVHDCSYSNGTCRCFSKYQFDRRSRRLIQTQKLRDEDIQLLVEYHLKEGRRVHHLQVGGHDYTRLFRGLEAVRHGEGAEGSDWNKGHVEACDPEDEVLWEQSVRFENIAIDERDDQGSSASYRESQYGKRPKRKVNGQTQQTPQERLELVKCHYMIL